MITQAAFGAICCLVLSLVPFSAGAEDAIIYSVYKGIDLGDPNETLQKDFYINLGTNQGIRVGSLLEVSRRTPSYDLTTEKLYKDLIFPFAKLKVIHAERDACVARLENIYSAEKTPVVVPKAVIVGDLVRPAR